MHLPYLLYMYDKHNEYESDIVSKIRNCISSFFFVVTFLIIMFVASFRFCVEIDWYYNNKNEHNNISRD